MKKQSAFSLIEVLIALLILSLGILGIGKMLLESHIRYQKAEIRGVATTIAWSIVQDLAVNKEGIGLASMQEYWQKKLEKVSRGSSLSIQLEKLKNPWIYTITIQFGLPTIPPLTLQVAVWE